MDLHVELGGVGAPQELGADVEVRAADDLPRVLRVLGELTAGVLGVLTVGDLEIGNLGPHNGSSRGSRSTHDRCSKYSEYSEYSRVSTHGGVL